jgi:thiosulfate/3-mercaptopyruvate sulfurtransferase
MHPEAFRAPKLVSYTLMAFTTLISTSELASRVAREDWAVVDCRFRLEDPGWGEREYVRQHIPGAAYAGLDADLSGPKTGRNGRHPLPSPDALVETFGRLGITSGIQVVVYDQDNGMFASRLWWMLRWMGHDPVAVLDGGFAHWLSEGRPTESGRPRIEPRKFAGAPRNEMLADVRDVAGSSPSSTLLVDARAPERYRGEIEPIDRVPGHIPGAVNHFFRTNLQEDGRMRPVEELKARWQATLGGMKPDEVITYCGSGVTACQNLLALEYAGLGGARLYPGSWSEWSSNPSRPVEKS